MNNILEHLPKLEGKRECQVDPYQEENSLDGGSHNRPPFVDKNAYMAPLLIKIHGPAFPRWI
jgi:hypothetical protein